MSDSPQKGVLFKISKVKNKYTDLARNCIATLFSGASLVDSSILTNGSGPLPKQFLLGASEKRMGRSFMASFVSHIVMAGLFIILVNLNSQLDSVSIDGGGENYSVVWLPVEGPGGGGGGGGNESLELPVQLELEGKDVSKLSVSVEQEPDLSASSLKEDPVPLQTQRINIPISSMASASDSRAGTFEGLMASLSESQGSGIGGGGGTGEGNGIGPGQGDGLGSGIGGGVGGGVYRPGSGIENPKPIQEVKPRYTGEAMRAKIQGSVWLEAVVLANGRVGDVRVTKSLDSIFGLDDEAIRAVRQWQFVPGTRLGEPVAVLVVIELSFTLR